MTTTWSSNGRPTTRLAIPVYETRAACVGAAASYVLRRIAYRAGAYAPGIQESIFHELHEARTGGDLDGVQRWFARGVTALRELGYRLECRRIASPARELLGWIEAGHGYRGAVLATRDTLHPPDLGVLATVHAVGVVVEGREAGLDGKLVMIDPWSHAGEVHGALDPALELAHRDRELDALALHWVGWS